MFAVFYLLHSGFTNAEFPMSEANECNENVKSPKTFCPPSFCPQKKAPYRGLGSSSGRGMGDHSVASAESDSAWSAADTAAALSRMACASSE